MIWIFQLLKLFWGLCNLHHSKAKHVAYLYALKLNFCFSSAVPRSVREPRNDGSVPGALGPGSLLPGQRGAEGHAGLEGLDDRLRLQWYNLCGWMNSIYMLECAFKAFFRERLWPLGLFACYRLLVQPWVRVRARMPAQGAIRRERHSQTASLQGIRYTITYILH